MISLSARFPGFSPGFSSGFSTGFFLGRAFSSPAWIGFLRVFLIGVSLLSLPVYAQGKHDGLAIGGGAHHQDSNGIDKLTAFLSRVHSLKASFEQILLDADRAELQRSEGSVVIARPKRFRWEYRTPYAQTIISNGKTFWIWDSELDQLTVKPMDKALGKSPAMLLSSDHPLSEDFVLTNLGEQNGMTWVMLEPRDPETDFNRIRIAFQGNTLVTMELNDSFDQVTRLHFSDMVLNPQLPDSTFEFETPDGADVLDGF